MVDPIADAVAQLAGVAQCRGEVHGRPMTMDEARAKVRDLAPRDAELLERLAELCQQAAEEAHRNPRPRAGGVSFKVGG